MCTMLKSGAVLIYALFFTSLLSAKLIVKDTNFTREWSSQTYNPAVLKLKNQLLTITKSNVSITLTSTDPSFKPCQVSINPETDHVTSKIRARALGNGKVVVWGVESPVDPNKDSRTVKYVVFIVDPQTCSAERLTTLTDEVPKSWSQHWGSLVTYQDSFDIFFPTQRICSPCRFSEKGEKIEVTYRLGQNGDEDKEYVLYSVDTMQENDPLEGYFYIYQFKNRSAWMRVLNEKFETESWQVTTSSWLKSYSTAKGYRGICIYDDKTIKSQSGKERYHGHYCGVMNVKQQNMVAADSVYIPKDRRPLYTTIRTLENGIIWVAAAYENLEQKSIEIYVQKLKAVPMEIFGSEDDEFSDPVDFQMFEENYPFEMEGIMLDEEYCLVTVENKELAEDYDEPEVNLTVKCMRAVD